MQPTVIVLSFNSEDTLNATLARARLVSDEIFVVDSYSQDGTVKQAEALGAIVVQHPFEHYVALSATGRSITFRSPNDGNCTLTPTNGWTISSFPRYRNYLTIPNTAPIFCPGTCAFSTRDAPWGHEPHMASSSFSIRRWSLRRSEIRPAFHRPERHEQSAIRHTHRRHSDTLTEWTARHNRWADGEVSELDADQTTGRVQPALFGSPTERKRFLR